MFDNIVPIGHAEGFGLFEAIPLRRSPTPPVIPDHVYLARKDAIVHLTDIYQGDGLKDVPRGHVKQLRLYSYHFAYQGASGLLGVVGLDGPWDVRRILGTVPVKPDGAAVFRVPANTPIAVQPLDGNGMALLQMRSWFVGMPGETVATARIPAPFWCPIPITIHGLSFPEDHCPPSLPRTVARPQ